MCRQPNNPINPAWSMVEVRHSYQSFAKDTGGDGL